MTNFNHILEEELESEFNVQSQQLEPNLTFDSNNANSSARDYQIEAVQKLWRALRDKNVPVCLVLPTGGGKTRVANDIVIKWMGDARDLSTRQCTRQEP